MRTNINSNYIVIMILAKNKSIALTALALVTHSVNTESEQACNIIFLTRLVVVVIYRSTGVTHYVVSIQYIGRMTEK